MNGFGPAGGCWPGCPRRWLRWLGAWVWWGRWGFWDWQGWWGRWGRVRQSVLTGNIRPLAEVKLGALGLGDPLDLAIGAYGDMDEVRAGLVQVARQRAAAAAGSDAAGSGGPVRWG